MEQGDNRFALRLVMNDILVAGGIVHDERAGEPGKMGGEFVADRLSSALAPGTAVPLSSTPGGTAEIQAFFIRAFLRIVFPRFYFSDSEPEKVAADYSFITKRKTPKTILASSRSRQPGRGGFEDIRTGAQFAAQSVQEKVYFFDSDFERPAGGGDVRPKPSCGWSRK